MKKRSLVIFFFVALVLLLPVFSQDAQPSKPSTIQTLSLEIVIRDSRKIEDGLSKLEFLFNSYESEVNRLLDEIDRIRREAAEDQRTVKDAS